MNLKLTFFALLLFSLTPFYHVNAQLGIGTTTPDPNAALDIESTTQGVLIPRMLKAQRELIGGGSPAAGMLVYQTDDVAGFYFYNGTAWVSLTTVKPSGLETVDEGNGNGIVRVGRNPANYGNVGENAVDLSYTSLASTTDGATGFSSTAMGISTTASGIFSTAMGGFSTASGSYSTAMGVSTTASGFGSTALGQGTQAESSVSTALGRYNVGGGSPSSIITTDPLFEIGNGTSVSNRSNALTVLKNGTITAPSFDIIEITDDKALITKEYADTNLKSSGLESIDEGNGNGLVRVGRNPANYGNVGENAVDLSISPFSSTSYGATDDYSTAMGFQTEASGSVSTAIGTNTTSSGSVSTAMGSFTSASGSVSTAIGSFTTAFGDVSTTLGEGTQAESYASTAIGLYNVGGGSPTSIITTDPLFEIGNGTSFSNRSNALTVLKNGNIGIGATTPSQALDVVGNAEINGAAIVTNNLQVDNTTLFVNASNNRVGIGTAGPLQALSVVGNAEVTGNLGIGTASPLAKLDVNGNAYVNGNIGIGATNPSDKLVIEGGRLEVLADIDASSSPGTGSIEVGNSLRIDGNEIITNSSSTLYLQQGNNGNLVVDGNTIFVDALNNRVGIGTSSPSKTLDVRGQIIAVSDNSPALIVTGSSNSPAGDNGIISSNPSYPGSDLFLRSNDEVVVQIDFDNNESGNFQVENSSGTNLFIVNESGNATLSGTLTENSDRRLKKNIETIPYGLTEILQLQPKAYNWKAKDQEHKSLGLIAQEVQEVIENVVRVADDEDKTLSLSYTSLVPVLIKATQEQQAIIDEQADKIKALEKQNLTLKELEVRLEKLEAKTVQ